MLKFTSLLFWIALCPTYLFGQIKINCCEIRQTIPVFKSDSAKLFLSHQHLLKTNVLLPLKKSDSHLEIRILSYYGHYSTTIVIKCGHNKVFVDRYYSSSAPFDTKYKYVGDVYPGDSLFVKHISGIKLQSPETWDLFFKKLIENHFFDLPNDNAITNIVDKENPKASSIIHDGAIYYEVKVGSHYRNVMYTNLFANEADKISFVKYQMNLKQLFSQFY